MLSMTGFGRASGAAGRRRLVVEVRSVNHRGLDVKVRGRGLTGASELEILRAVRSALARGSVIVSVDDERAPDRGGDLPGLAVERVRAAHAALEAMRVQLAIATPVDLATVAAFLRLSGDGGAIEEIAWEALRPLLEQALAALTTMRAREGEALARDFEGRIALLRTLATDLREATGGLPARALARLEERVRGLVRDGVDAARLAQELALLADRLDVSEELTRLETHLGALGGLVSGAQTPREGVGRTLEFLLQEVGRELSTLGAKSQDAAVAATVIRGKAELEKMREQAQNIE